MPAVRIAAERILWQLRNRVSRLFRGWLPPPGPSAPPYGHLRLLSPYLVKGAACLPSRVLFRDQSSDRGTGPDWASRPHFARDKERHAGDAHKAGAEGHGGGAEPPERGGRPSPNCQRIRSAMRSSTAGIRRSTPQAEQEVIRNAYDKALAEAQARSESLWFDPAVLEFLGGSRRNEGKQRVGLTQSHENRLRSLTLAPRSSALGQLLISAPQLPTQLYIY